VIKYLTPKDQSENHKLQSDGFLLLIFLALIGGLMCGFRSGQKQAEFCLETGINPNTASVSSLMRLPNIGESRALAIIDYRQRFETQDSPAFKKAEDLRNIKGIGPVILRDMRDMLSFDSD
jgi:competence ComEA-like helix-hairpin-helix protein